MATEPIAPLTRYERIVIVLLCLAGAIRVFVFGAAFPFFNNVDEQLHFDLVFKYSRGHLPAAPLEKFDLQAAEIIARSATGEYLNFQTDHSPAYVAGATASFASKENLETWAWPAYYMLAGLWCRLGQSLAFTNTGLLYWIRFLNVPLSAALVWLSFIFCRKFLRASIQQQIALPLMVAFFPQDIFYSITSDALSPLIFAWAFFILLKILLSEIPNRRDRLYHLFTGLIVAVTFLTKASNIAIVPLAAGVILIKTVQAVRQKQLKQYLPSFAAFVAAAVIPVAFWLGRNYVLFGDLSGAAASMKDRTWTIKPFSEFFNHPILTPSGLFYFLTELTRTFWRGEFVWHWGRIAFGFMDWFYVISSAVFITVSILGLVINKPEKEKSCRYALAAGVFVIVFSVVFLAYMSMRYDFGQCFYPSRKQPYFTSGRLIAGTIVPFLMLYVDGLQRILSKLRCASCLLIAVSIIVIAITVSEIILTLPVFASPYNWFHLH